MASNILMSMEGVEGESELEVEGYDTPIEIQSFSHSFVQPTNPSVSSHAQTIEKATHSPITISKQSDKASPVLMESCWKGKVYQNETKIAMLREMGDTEKSTPVLEIIMKGVVISSFSISAGPGDVPYETLSLSYTSVQYKYHEGNKDDGTETGSVPIMHDLRKNTVSGE